MAEYIEREALKNRFAKRLVWLKKDIHDEYSLGLHDGCEYDTKLIDEILAADVAPVVHGRWIQVIVHVEFEDGFVDRVEEYCSACHEPNERRCTYFCHNCGAKMDLPDECKQEVER